MHRIGSTVCGFVVVNGENMFEPFFKTQMI